jgi:hypothetical protein
MSSAPAISRRALLHAGLASALLTACQRREPPRSASEQLESAERILRLHFPPGAHLFGAEHHDRNGGILIKVAIPQDEWPAFEATLPIREAQLRPGEAKRLGPNADFWDPLDHPQLLYGYDNLPYAALYIGVDKSPRDQVLLFMHQIGY